ncbi:MAG: YraN family protein [Alistipes sp.]|nr:YraN family protein [Alistipes sp.]
MTRDRAVTGREGERAAAEYLRRRGYAILATNWRSGRYELDIVAVGGGCIRFVEVKTRDAEGLTAPEEALTAAKCSFMVSAATRYLALHGCREEPHLDLAAVDVLPDGEYRVRYIADAVECHW